MTAMMVGVRKVGSVAVIAPSDPLHDAHSTETLRAFDDALDALAKLSGIRAVVLICQGVNHYVVHHAGHHPGHEPRSGHSLRASGSSAAEQHACHRLFARLEEQRVPVVAALHGAIQGSLLGMALACHYRVAESGARFGLPEIALGLIPVAGCTQRLPRLIGVERTLRLIMEARPVDVQTALEWGLIDEVVTDDLLQSALIFAEQLIVDGKGPRRTRDMQVDPAGCSDAMLEHFSAYAGKHYPNRIVPFTAIKAVRSSVQLPFVQGLELESALLEQAGQTVECRALMHVVEAERQAREIPGLTMHTAARPVKKVGIVGAGHMGAGIAICCVNAGVPVTVIDVDGDALDRGLTTVDRVYESMVGRGRLTAAEKAQRMSLITGSLDYADLKDADLVIESVFENMELKRQIFSRLDQATRAGTVLASNTSTLDINVLGAVTSRPDEVIGMHFFSPAHVMPLLEVIRTDATSAATIRTVMDFAKILHKTPVLARVCYGFIGNRMMECYAREAKRMVLEGAAPGTVDATLERWGMAMGVLAVTDLTDIDTAVRVHEANAMRLPVDPAYFQSDRALYEAGRLGQKNGRGYYRYDVHERTRHDDPEVMAIFKARATQLGIAPRDHSPQEILERCLYPLLNEGLRILEEGIAQRSGDIDVVWVDGYGFPRYRGGPMFHVDTTGLPILLNGMLRYQKIFGPMNWQPAKLLVELVAGKQTLSDWQQVQSRTAP